MASSTQYSNGGAPPILPMYKANHLKGPKNPVHHRRLAYNVLVIFFPIALLALFFFSIYFGTSFLQDHIDAENESANYLSVGLPNTRNRIRKWSVDHLGGLDITSLGDPVRVHNTEMNSTLGYFPAHDKNSSHFGFPFHMPALVNMSSTADYYRQYQNKLRGSVHWPNNSSSLLKYASFLQKGQQQ